jgi:two-component system sensor kinase FixL
LQALGVTSPEASSKFEEAREFMDPLHGITSAFDRRSALPLIRGLAGLHDSMVLVDDQEHVVWMSDGLASMCGDPEQFRGRSWVEMLFIQGEGERLAETLSRVGYLANEPVSIHGPGGESIPVKLSASRLGDAEASWATITIARPETHATGRPFSDSLDGLKAILDTSPDGVVVVDRNRQITYLNPAAEHLLDRPQAEIIGKPVDLYVDRCERLKRIAEALRPSRPVRDEDIQLRRRDGTVICVSISASLLRLQDGTDLGAVAYLRDVTERRHTEEDLARSNAQLEHYVDAVSHDLRSPLVSLLGFSRLLRDDYGARLDEKGRHFLDRIEQAGHTMERLIHDLLELSRIGQTEVSKSFIDPRSVLAHLHAEFKPRLDQEGVSLELPGNPPHLRCDRTRLYQLFSNLVGNALDHMGSVERPTIRVKVNALPGAHQITVSDNGRGIDPSDQDRIFEIFRSLGPHKNGRRGTGMGLAIVKKIVEIHGGRVWVESHLGKGANFHLILPCGPASA